MTLNDLQSYINNNQARKFKIVFPIQSLASGDRYINLHIDLTNGIANPASYAEYTYNSDSDFDIYIMGDDVDEIDFNDRQFWVLLRKKPFEFSDANNILGYLLTHPNCILDQIKMEYYFRKPSEQNFTLEFTGYMNQDNIVYNNYQGHLQCEFMPKIGDLNRIPTFNTNGTYNNIITTGYDWSSGYDDGNIGAKYLIEQIYKAVNPDVQINWFQDWTFFATMSDGQGHTFNVEKSINDLWYHWQAVFMTQTQNGWTPNSYSTYMQVLKSLCFDLGCYTGMLSQDKAIVQLFIQALNSNNQIYIPDDMPFTYEQKVNNNTIKYLLLKADNTMFAQTNTYTPFSDEKLEMPIYPDIWRIYYNSTPYVAWVTNDVNNENMNKPNFLLYYWSQYYLNPFNARRDTLKLPGIDWDILKRLLYKSINYLITKLTVNRSQNFSECECVPLG